MEAIEPVHKPACNDKSVEKREKVWVQILVVYSTQKTNENEEIRTR